MCADMMHPGGCYAALVDHDNPPVHLSRGLIGSYAEPLRWPLPHVLSDPRGSGRRLNRRHAASLELSWYWQYLALPRVHLRTPEHFKLP